jgi:hypothetical protein
VNRVKLKQAEQEFLQRYPGGFSNLEISAIRKKKHNVDKMIAFAQESLAKRNFKLPNQIVENMAKLIGRSSVISVFEKARFRDFAFGLSSADKKFLSSGLEELLHGREQAGFESVLGWLQSARLGKWSLMTVCQTYYHPQKDVLVKPNTVKNIIAYFELRHLQYKPAPSWAFYAQYRSTLHEMKSNVDASLSPTNAAFSWFLLLSTRGVMYQ